MTAKFQRELVINGMFSPGTLFYSLGDTFEMPAESSVQLRSNDTHHLNHHHNHNLGNNITTSADSQRVTMSNNNNKTGISGSVLSANSPLQDKSRLLLLAERTNTRKTSSSSSPSHLLSFRNSLSPKKSSPVVDKNNSFMRKNITETNPEMPESRMQTPRQNPKLYTSFSSKSASKFTKAFIKSDPAKTNIEHLVGGRTVTPNVEIKSDHCESGRGLNTFITPLKALHASFHDRTKLSNAFAPRSRLFSTREKSSSNTQLIKSGQKGVKSSDSRELARHSTPTLPKTSTNNPNGSQNFVNDGKCSPDFLEYFGNNAERNYPNVIQNLGNGGENVANNNTRAVATPDILEDCMGFDTESGYIILDRGKRALDLKNNGKRVVISSNKNPEKETQLNPIESKGDGLLQNCSYNYKSKEGIVNETDSLKMMSSATPMKISSSSSVCKAQIITLMARSNNNSVDNESTIDNGSMKPQNTTATCDAKTAGVNFKEVSSGNKRMDETNLFEKNPFRQQEEQPLQEKKSHPDIAGSSTWTNSKNVDKSEQDITPLITTFSNMGMQSCMREPPSEMNSVTDYNNQTKMSQTVGTGLLANIITTETHLSNHYDMTSGIGNLTSCYQNVDKIQSKDYDDLKFQRKENLLDESVQSNHKCMIEGKRPTSRKLSSRSSRLKSKYRPQKHLMQSLSFRSDGKFINNGCGYSNMNENKFNRNRSRSLPKSFMSVKNGLRRNISSLWTRDELLFQRLEDSKTCCPETPVHTHLDSAKMRWQKSATPSSSSSSTTGADGRPKSFDYSQRKAWMKYYRDMEVSSATSNSSLVKGSKAVSKGSISHLHLVESQDNVNGLEEDGRYPVHGNQNPSSDMGIARRTPDALGLQPNTPSSSLFQRFSKTFSLRFGSNSNVSKVSNNNTNGKKIKGPLGSSPDLHNGSEYDGGKMRKGKLKSGRGEKCQSGDSGIGMDEPHPPGTNRLRRIRSELIETSSSNSNSTSRAGTPVSSSSALTKMSLVEIPNHVWEEGRNHQNNPNSTSNMVSACNGSYEDILEAKLDADDDGFSSSEESSSKVSNRNENLSHYHTLPSKHSRKNKQKDPPGNLCPSGRSQSLEESTPVEDNSIRGKVIKEIIFTEQNYVKTLNDIVQGFLNPCRARRDLFSSETVRNIFSNVEDILRLHARFLEALKERVDPKAISSSNVGQVFTEWADHFDMYSEYCCNNPISMVTVRSLIQSQDYAEFFEACRRLQLMDKLPLHGFLLRPIQRICQYHLQLNELLKQTEVSHEDYPSVVHAVETMKSVAMKINDTQRQFDSLQEIIRLQNSIEGWEGPDLILRNSVVLSKGELVKTVYGKRSKEVHCVLLNKDLVYYKKDFIRKGGFVFDGRIDLEVGVWLNIDSNEEDEFFGMVHNAWRIYSPELKTWILFTAPSPSEKRKWITALERTVEVYTVDQKMCDMAKLITVLSDDRPLVSQPYSSSTLPKSSKKSKGKHSSSNGKVVDADAMLIEVSKLKRPTYISQQASMHKERTSKFYV